MGLRETFEKLATEFAYEILAVVKAGRVDEVPRVEHRPQRNLRGHDPKGAVDAPPILPKPTRGEPASPIRIPAEKLHIRLDGLLLTNRLWNVLSREGYAVLGDLDGRTFADLTQHRGFGRQCQKELRRLLAGGRTNRSVPGNLRPLLKLNWSSKIRVLVGRRHVRLADIGLSPHVHAVLSRHGYLVLGDLDGRTAKSLVVHEDFGPRCDRELRRALVDGGLVVGPTPKARRRAPLARSHRPHYAGDEQTSINQDEPTLEAESKPGTSAPVTERRSGEIRVPPEKHQLRVDDLIVSTRLSNVFGREGYVVLGDLDGKTLVDLKRHRGFGRVCHRELRRLLEKVGALGPPMQSSQPADPVVVDARPRIVHATFVPAVPALDVHVRAREKLARSLAIYVPAERRQMLIEELPVSVRLFNALSRNGYVVLGDLDGRTLGHLFQHRGFGRACLDDLRGVLLDLGIVPTVPPPTRLQVPAFAMMYRLDELRLSGPSQKFVRRTGVTVLGDLHDKSALDMRSAGSKVVGEFASMIEAMAVNGPPEPGGLLDHLDAGLDALKERHRQVLLLRLGGTGEAPLTLAEIARRLNITPERVRQVQGHALERLPAVAGPGFGAAIRDLDARVSAEGADVAAELGRTWRRTGPTNGTAVPRTWANTGFYIRLLARLSSGIEAAVFPPKVSQAATTTSDNR